ncbi:MULTISPECIES: DnaD domain protein [Staphylococcus]|uniref:DnaD domain protein n=1 Tax=Staphylococcus TaxID=1279 RepID=UPI0009BEBFA9|nr:DnaD domain protein [Staphylococcus equorum]MDK9845200.1 DnaD domain protein [Staphylococcus equorum]MDK9849113.1 DnaD domain protein [Staphylococcus equorum]MDK9854420.1 DnaD domain protein [Staphylococcus equorum]
MTDSIKSSVSGYGLVFKRVMKDTDISIEAKALYSYLSAYAGANETAFPGVSLICHELNISDKRFQKYRKQLEDNGYLSIERERTSNGFSKNIYTIEHNPVSGHFVPVQNLPGRNLPGQNVGTTINSIKNNNNTSDVTAKIFEYISNNLEMIQSPLKIDEIEYEINMIKDDAYEITKIAVDYCKENNKGIPYLISILKNWNKEGIDTVEKAKAKVEPKKRKQPKKESDNFLERKRQELMGG